MVKMSQKIINRMIKKSRSQWRKLLAESGSREKEFIAENKAAKRFLGQYALVQEEVIKSGFKMDDLLKGVTVILKRKD